LTLLDLLASPENVNELMNPETCVEINFIYNIVFVRGRSSIWAAVLDYLPSSLLKIPCISGAKNISN
jgi:hypothetical protein